MGTGERFEEFHNDVPGAKYDLPEVTGTDTCPAAFGKMTGERFDEFFYDVQPAFNKAAIKKSNTCGFGKVTGKRFRAPKKTLGGSYNTEKSWKEQGGATFGKTSAGRFGPNRGF